MKNQKQKISYKNNWEHISYFAGRQELSLIKQVIILGKKYKVTSSQVSKDYSDMGHTYTAYFTQFYITQKVFGKNYQFTLQSLLDKKVSILIDSKDIPKEEK